MSLAAKSGKFDRDGKCSSAPYINRAGARLCHMITSKEAALPEPSYMTGRLRPY